MADPRSPEFWQSENTKLWSAINELMMTILISGAESGAALLPASLRLSVNWDAFNQQAIDFLRTYRLQFVNAINDTTRQKAVTAIAEWVQSGDPLTTLETRLTPLFGSNRASMIASTEVTRIYAQGNLEVWKSTGFIGAKKWQTARDQLVCPLCGPLHNTIVQISSDFTQTVRGVAESPQMQRLVGGNMENAVRRAQSVLMGSGMSVNTPPRHPRCRCWLLPVVDVDLAQQQRRARLGL